MRPTLLGDAALDAEIDGFLLRSPTPSSTEVVNFLKLYSKDQREDVGRALIAKGVASASVAAALTWLVAADRWNPSTFWGVASIASSAASAYHGYKRNNSIAWAVVWGILGGVFPVFMPVLAIAQGFGKHKA